jgi:hypothetical protein
VFVRWLHIVPAKVIIIIIIIRKIEKMRNQSATV